MLRLLARLWNKWFAARALDSPPEDEPPMKVDQPIRIGSAGIALIKRFEGLRLYAYSDPVGIITIGYGHTKTARKGQAINEEKAESLLREDLLGFERCISQNVDVPLSQEQFDALVSFAFNVGCGAFGDSTLLRKLNNLDYSGAADEFPRWNKAGGAVLHGLTRRRNAERGLFLS